MIGAGGSFVYVLLLPLFLSPFHACAWQARLGQSRGFVARAGYEATKEAAPQLLFSKQLRCLEGPDGSWNLDRNAPLCPDSKMEQPVRDQSGAVPVCPGETVTLTQASHATDVRVSWDAVFGARSAA